MTIRWGILGCGDVCEVKSGPAFQRVPGSELVAVMRRSGALAADFARRHGVPSWYDDADHLIDDERVNAVYIASPPGNHLELALRVCARGKPAYVEKPMARNHAECLTMVDAFTRAKVPLFVAYYRRALPRFLRVKQLIDSGRLGTVTGVYCRYASSGVRGDAKSPLPWRVRAEQAGGGLFLDLASHTLDLLDFLCGPLSDVEGVAANVASAHDVEDNVALRFRTPTGALGTGVWNFASAIDHDEVTIQGREGELRFSTFAREPFILRTSAGIEAFDLPNPEHIQEPLIRTIVDALGGVGDCPSTGLSAARTSAVMDAALSSYYGSRSEGFWLDPGRWPGRRRGAVQV
jgi:1,5-anhydro-D-fructose reductase (1,5-anhydro-D-mannitol-forming)